MDSIEEIIGSAIVMIDFSEFDIEPSRIRNKIYESCTKTASYLFGSTAARNTTSHTALQRTREIGTLWKVPAGNHSMGLANVGLSCFLNSVLNCLYFLPPLYHSFSTFNQAKLTGLTVLICRFVQIYGRWGIPEKLLVDIRECFPEFQDTAMKSVYGFLLSVLQLLREESFQLPTPVAGLSISDIFNLSVEATRTCSVCQACVSSPMQLQFLSLTLSPSHGDLSLLSCLQGFLAEERDTEANTHLCRRCECEQIHILRRRITHLGAALVIYLQRYNSADPEAQVTVPASLDLSKCLPGAGEYSLSSAIRHSGSLEWGHYTCCAKAGNGWMHFNDSCAQFVDFPQDFFNSSTLFVYVRVSKLIL